MISGNTHSYTYNGKTMHNQLDYCYSNVEQLESKIGTGVAGSDHSSIIMSIQITCEVFTVPEKYVVQGGIDSDESLNMLLVRAADKIVAADVETGDAILELDIVAFELRQQVVNFRRIKEHERIAGTSRQISAVMLRKDLSKEVKRAELKKLFKKEAARRLLKGATSGSFGSKIMVPLSMAPKKKQILECKVDPEIFKNAILVEEKVTDHKCHDQLPPALSHLITKIEGDDFKLVLSSMRSKWGRRPGFSEKFWSHIIGKLNTPSVLRQYNKRQYNKRPPKPKPNVGLEGGLESHVDNRKIVRSSQVTYLRSKET